MLKFCGKNKFENPKILHRFYEGQTLDTLQKLYGPHFLENKNTKIYDGACAILCCMEQNFYVVKPADTLLSISKKLHISQTILKEKNSIKKLFVGQILRY